MFNITMATSVFDILYVKIIYLYGFTSLCCIMCLFRWLVWVKALWHTWHLWGLIPWCVSRCVCRWLSCLNSFPHR